MTRYAFTWPTVELNIRGIQLEVRGDSRLFQAKLIPPDPALPAPSLAFIPDSEWQKVRLPAAWLAAHSPQQSNLVLELLVDGPPGDFQLDIDEIRFY